MENKKTSKGLKVLLVILIIILLCLIGFIVYDKVITKDSSTTKTDTKEETKTEDSTEEAEENSNGFSGKKYVLNLSTSDDYTEYIKFTSNTEYEYKKITGYNSDNSVQKAVYTGNYTVENNVINLTTTLKAKVTDKYLLLYDVYDRDVMGDNIYFDESILKSENDKIIEAIKYYYKNDLYNSLYQNNNNVKKINDVKSEGLAYNNYKTECFVYDEERDNYDTITCLTSADLYLDGLVCNSNEEGFQDYFVGSGECIDNYLRYDRFYDLKINGDQYTVTASNTGP